MCSFLSWFCGLTRPMSSSCLVSFMWLPSKGDKAVITEGSAGLNYMSKMTHPHGWQLILAVSWEFSWACQPDCQHVASPCGLGFSQRGGFVLRLSIPRDRRPTSEMAARPVKVSCVEMARCHFHQIQ